MSEITEEQLQALKDRDGRVQALDEMLATEAELRDSKVLNRVLDQAAKQAQTALEALATVNPSDVREIIHLQAIVYRARFLGASINATFEAGHAAEESLHENGLDVDQE